MIQQHHRDFVLHGESREYETFTVGVVTSITRDGMVKMFKEAGHVDHVDWTGKPDRGQDVPTIGFVRAILGPAAEIDVTGALATAACHVWITGKDDEAHETHVKAYDSLAELQAALKPHRLSEPTAADLHDAAANHAITRREAWEAHQRDERPPGQRGYDREYQSAKYAAYVAAVTAANEAYRAAYAAATEREPIAA